MKPNFYIEDILDLFDAVQRAEIFADQKTFCDAIPKFDVEIINQKHRSEKGNSNFDLKHFIDENFDFKKDNS
jgi:alpha,alpha-trehalase